MRKFIPMFPLQMVVFPGEDLNLHIFEPRYRQLIGDCETEGISFGIPAFINGKVSEIGTEISLISIEKRYPGGEMDIRTRAAGVFRIHRFYRQTPEKLYPGAETDPLDLDLDEDESVNEQILDLTRDLFQVLGIRKNLPETAENFLTYQIAHHVGFSIEQEYELLLLRNAIERQELMLLHLERVIPMAREMENLRKRAQMNGHFKNVIPPDLKNL
ncbi:MAG: LON peptidase substrate-binding domain-containing protein [Saprospiraceae bacterium]|nr:LON peptidase substrate-binding domain-containing protein [Saprospiraceae bacterium]